MSALKSSTDSKVESTARSVAIGAVLVYAISASLWILLWDSAAGWMQFDSTSIPGFGALKDWLFVAVTTGLLYGLIRKALNRVIWATQNQLQGPKDQAPSRQILDSLIEGSSDLIFAKDLQGRYLMCNPETARLAGKTPMQVLGQEERILFPGNSRQMEQNDLRVIQECRTVTFEETISTVDGERTFLSTKGPLRSSDGQVYGLFGIAHDITQRKQMETTLFENEARLQTLIRSIPDLIWLKDLKGVYLACNSSFEQFFGAKEIDIVGNTDYDFVDKGLADLFRTNDKIAMNKGGPSVNEEWVTFASNGKKALLETTKTPLRTQDGKVIGVLGIGHDITERHRLHETVARNEIRLQTILKTSSDGIHILDSNGILVEANDAFLNMLGLEKSAIGMVSVTSWDVLSGWEAIKVFNDDLIESQKKCLFETRHRHMNGTIFDVEISASGIVIDGKGYLYAASRDITHRKQMQSALMDGEKRYRTILEWTPEPVVVQKNGKLLYINPAAVKLFGAHSVEELINIPVINFVHPDSRQLSLERSRKLNEGGIANALVEQKYIKLDGTTIHVEVQSTWITFDGEPAVLVAIRDITERQAAEKKIAHLAFYDSLTSLPNRRLMLDRLDQALITAARQRCHGALMLIDLDNFKLLNDTLGHSTGDHLLIEVALRLRACIRDGDTVARMGGDEFVVILNNLSESENAAIQAEQVATKIRASLGQAYVFKEADANVAMGGGSAYFCTSSIGIATFRDQSISVDDLLKRADTAMYQAKAAGKNTVRFFDLEMQAEVALRAAMEVELRTGIIEKQLVLFYQAQVNSDGYVIGAEALVRWQHPLRGMIPPNEFIALAEDSGLILPLGQWVLEDACAQLQKWSKSSTLCHITVAVNVSARQFAQPSFVDQVLEVARRFEIPAGHLKLELTESLLLENTEAVIAKMNLLKLQGILFSLDDFGTGYSSLAYLKRLPLDQLKIDQSFIRDVLTDQNDAAITRTVVALGRSLGLKVIAEGVETAAQRDFLIRNHCFVHQGYLYSRPLPSTLFEEFALRYVRSDEFPDVG